MLAEVDENLTTDAIPSPPRDDKEEIPPENGKEDINATPDSHTPKYKIPRSARTKKHSPTAFASVINISNSQKIHIGSNYNFYVHKSDDTQKNKEHVVTEAIRTMFASAQPVSKEDIRYISIHMNEEWRDTARTLGYSDGQISQFYLDYVSIGMKEIIYQFLLDWIQNGADDATIGKLSTALWETNQKDVVKYWSENISRI